MPFKISVCLRIKCTSYIIYIYIYKGKVYFSPLIVILQVLLNSFMWYIAMHIGSGVLEDFLCNQIKNCIWSPSSRPTEKHFNWHWMRIHQWQLDQISVPQFLRRRKLRKRKKNLKKVNVHWSCTNLIPLQGSVKCL